jgi:hypothetical protein
MPPHINRHDQLKTKITTVLLYGSRLSLDPRASSSPDA